MKAATPTPSNMATATNQYAIMSRPYHRPMAVPTSPGHSTSQYRQFTASQLTTAYAYLRAWHRAFTWHQRIGILLMVLGGVARLWWALTMGV